MSIRTALSWSAKCGSAIRFRVLWRCGYIPRAPRKLGAAPLSNAQAAYLELPGACSITERPSTPTDLRWKPSRPSTSTSVRDWKLHGTDQSTCPEPVGANDYSKACPLMRPKVCAYPQQGNGPRFNQQARYISATSAKRRERSCSIRHQRRSSRLVQRSVESTTKGGETQ